MLKFKVVRMYSNKDIPPKEIIRGLDIEQIERFINSPESNSNTCTEHPLNSNYLDYLENGPWMDFAVQDG